MVTYSVCSKCSKPTSSESAYCEFCGVINQGFKKKTIIDNNGNISPNVLKVFGVCIGTYLLALLGVVFVGTFLTLMLCGLDSSCSVGPGILALIYPITISLFAITLQALIFGNKTRAKIPYIYTELIYVVPIISVVFLIGPIILYISELSQTQRHNTTTLDTAILWGGIILSVLVPAFLNAYMQIRSEYAPASYQKYKKSTIFLTLAITIPTIIVATGLYFYTSVNKLNNSKNLNTNASESTTELKTTKKYLAPDYSFSFNIPNNWEVTESSSESSMGEYKRYTFKPENTKPFTEWSTITKNIEDTPNPGDYSVIQQDSAYMVITVDVFDPMSIPEKRSKLELSNQELSKTLDPENDFGFESKDGYNYCICVSYPPPYIDNPNDRIIFLTKNGKVHIENRKTNKFYTISAQFNTPRPSVYYLISSDFEFNEHPDVKTVKEIFKTFRLN